MAKLELILASSMVEAASQTLVSPLLVLFGGRAYGSRREVMVAGRRADIAIDVAVPQ